MTFVYCSMSHPTNHTHGEFSRICYISTCMDFIIDIYLCILVHEIFYKTYCSVGQTGFYSCFSHIIHYIKFYVTMAVADLGERLRGYSLLLAMSRNTEDSLHWYKNALKHINFCIKYHFYIIQNITSPYLLMHCTHHVSWFICIILCILLALFKNSSNVHVL